MKVYAYVDGAFPRDRSSVAVRQMFDCEPDLDFDNVRRVLDAQRLFYYDCVEIEPRLGETHDVHELRTRSIREMLKHIGRSPMCHVRLGTLKQQQGRRRISQKEVDVKIAVDMLTHGADRSLERAILVTGDLDFRPVVESLVQLGIVVEIAYDPLVTADELLEAADIRRPLDIHNWIGMCSNRSKKAMPYQHVGLATEAISGGRSTRETSMAILCTCGNQRTMTSLLKSRTTTKSRGHF